VTTEKWAAVDEISRFRALDGPDSVTGWALLMGEGYVDRTSLWRGEPARLGGRT
jgi:hypothetical protein